MVHKKVLLYVLMIVFMTVVATGCDQSPVDTVTPDQVEIEQVIPESAKTVEEDQQQDREPDGVGVLLFTVTVHLEGWEDDINEQRFHRHAALLREYADLFEQYGAVLTLESKEMTAGCFLWGDNVLGEMEQRGHAVAVHADVGAKPGDTRSDIRSKLTQAVGEMRQIGLDPRHVSGVCSRADWVSATADTGFEAVTGVVSYGLWSLDKNLRPEGFRPYKNIVDGHLHYPWNLSECVNPWMAKDGATWTTNHPTGRILIIPAGPNLIYAFEESQSDGQGVISGEFTVDDITVWDETLAEALEYTDSDRINTLYAVWSFGSVPDMVLMEQWLQMVDRYVQAGRLEWKTLYL